MAPAINYQLQPVIGGCVVTWFWNWGQGYLFLIWHQVFICQNCFYRSCANSGLEIYILAVVLSTYIFWNNILGYILYMVKNLLFNNFHLDGMNNLLHWSSFSYPPFFFTNVDISTWYRNNLPILLLLIIWRYVYQ